MFKLWFLALDSVEGMAFGFEVMVFGVAQLICISDMHIGYAYRTFIDDLFDVIGRAVFLDMHIYAFLT